MSKKEENLVLSNHLEDLSFFRLVLRGFKYIFKAGIFLIFVFIILDQVTKQVFQFVLKNGKVIHFIPGLLDFQLVYNDGAAFGTMAGNRFFLIGAPIVMGAAMIGFLAVTFRKITWIGRYSLYMMIGGCFGNFVDRAFYPDGKVVDFIKFTNFFGFKNFAVFNLADSFLVLGIGFFVVGEIAYLIYERYQHSKQLKYLDLKDKPLENIVIKKIDDIVCICDDSSVNYKKEVLNYSLDTQEFSLKDLENLNLEDFS